MKYINIPKLVHDTLLALNENKAMKFILNPSKSVICHRKLANYFEDDTIKVINYKNNETKIKKYDSNIWKRLPSSVRNSENIETFKTRLRTFYFHKWLTD